MWALSKSFLIPIVFWLLTSNGNLFLFHLYYLSVNSEKFVEN